MEEWHHPTRRHIAKGKEITVEIGVTRVPNFVALCEKGKVLRIYGSSHNTNSSLH